MEAEGLFVAIEHAEGRVVAAGRSLAIVEALALGPRHVPLVDAARAIAITPRGLVLATSRGLLMVPLDVGIKHGAASELWDRPDVTSVAFVGGRIFALGGGDLAVLDLAGGSAKVILKDVDAMAAAAGTVLARRYDGTFAALRGQDSGFEEIAISSGAELAAFEHFRVNAELAVLGWDDEGVRVARPGETRPSEFSLRGVIDVVFMSNARDADMLVVSSDEQTVVLSVANEKLGLREVKRLSRTEGSVRCLAWDSTRELAFLAGNEGMIALGPRKPH
jgi:hypothetical protein